MAFEMMKSNQIRNKYYQDLHDLQLVVPEGIRSSPVYSRVIQYSDITFASADSFSILMGVLETTQPIWKKLTSHQPTQLISILENNQDGFEGFVFLGCAYGLPGCTEYRHALFTNDNDYNFVRIQLP